MLCAYGLHRCKGSRASDIPLCMRFTTFCTRVRALSAAIDLLTAESST
jgi:hypothetical protein